ncbi:uncharacterized protein [Nicotiana tomentosiformis]|uniref:uncharacterized protein n=1 Tax=Nicotiana tomentosiformis TaxID=4098 RepID=UPI001447C587|nr:uncharacterized protein LOC104096910 [Nicotiana tomentosiformis]XP_033512223.1 uncharacterized protein LOC104096910 [Nicotiana tomentosiformis]
MATVEKNALLLQRRLKKREATTNRLLGSRKFINLAESMSAIQGNVIVGGSSSISKIFATDCEVFTPPNVLDKGKNVIHPISIFEKGSTSSTSGKSSAPTTETVQVDGHVKNKRNMTNIIRLCLDYVSLKKVPNCKFCLAKKFQYESPGFCCGRGFNSPLTIK